MIFSIQGRNLLQYVKYIFGKSVKWFFISLVGKNDVLIMFLAINKSKTGIIHSITGFSDFNLRNNEYFVEKKRTALGLYGSIIKIS